MLSEKLRENTKIAHQELEKLLVRKIRSIQTAGDYLEILVCFSRFFCPLEKAISFQLQNTLPDISKRRKTEWIEEDINYFQPSYSVIPTCPAIPEIYKDSQAVGALYVIEGSTLGGQVICRMVSQRLGISPEKGFKFFSGYGDTTAEMWGDFKKYVNSRNWTEKEEDEVIDAANQTFDSFKQSLH